MTRFLYLAGPSIFRPDARVIGHELKQICLAHGCEGLYPLDGSDAVKPGHDRRATACLHYVCNMAMLGKADAVVADIAPFRGPHMDPGTAFEIGWAVARSIPVFAYTAEPKILIERMESELAYDPAPVRRDLEENLIEDFGLAENLMISIPSSGPWSTAEAAISAAAHHLMSKAA